MAHITEWFMRARWDVNITLLTGAEVSVDDWNRRVDAFDVDGLSPSILARSATALSPVTSASFL